MSKELIVHSSQHETRLAILEDDHLVELHIESESQHALAGSIYKGRVTRVLPGMQSAFVNIGLDRDAFLYVSDFFDESDEEFDQVPVAAAGGGAEESEQPSASVAPAANGAAAQEDGSVPEKPVDAEEVRPGGRDRRGRRSRRRRGRGSSFPATKYADVEAEGESGEEESKVSAAAEKDASGEASSRDAAAETEFVVLPGESLAKYSAASAEPYSDAAAETDGPDSRSRGREEAVGPESLIDGDVPDSTAFEPRQGTEDHPQIAQDSREDESLDTEPSGSGEPSEQDLVAGSVPTSAGENQVESLEENESLLSSDREEETQPDEQSAANAEQESEDTDRAEEAAGEPAVAEASAATPEADDELDDAAPEEVAPEPQIAEAPSREEPAEATPAAAPREPEKLPEPSEPDDEHHAFPGYPGPPMADPDENGGSGEGVASGSINGSETGQTASDGSEDSEPREGATEGDASDASDSREARVRGRSESSRYVHRRGHRGRRKSRRQREQAEGEASNDAAPSSESGTNNGGEGRKITDLLAKGQEVLVQISKEPLGRKGARITSHIALPGRFLVYMPTVDHIGVSRKIPSDKERVRLRKIVQTHRTGMPGGFIVRTAGEGVTEEDIRGDMLFLYNQWLDIRDRSETTPSPALLHHDDDVVERILRDRVGDDFKTIWVDAEAEYERILRFVERFQPDLLKSVKLYTRGKPMFDQFNITNELAKALRPKVWLKSGGYIVINQTEALVAIDVNTGKYVGKSDRLEDTIVNTNLEAVEEIVRQLRIRDLGGIIVVDFIDMEDRSNRQQVLSSLEKDLRADMAPSKVLPFNEFGLVAITRKRVKQSLERALCTPCPYCHGSATVKSVQTVIQEILGEARKMARSKDLKKDITLRVNQEIARKLKSRDNNYIQEIEQILRGHVLVRSDVSLHREHFDID